jgi:hypothetical protein
MRTPGRTPRSRSNSGSPTNHHQQQQIRSPEVVPGIILNHSTPHEVYNHLGPDSYHSNIGSVSNMNIDPYRTQVHAYQPDPYQQQLVHNHMASNSNIPDIGGGIYDMYGQLQPQGAFPAIAYNPMDPMGSFTSPMPQYNNNMMPQAMNTMAQYGPSPLGAPAVLPPGMPQQQQYLPHLDPYSMGQGQGLNGLQQVSLGLNLRFKGIFLSTVDFLHSI